MAEQQIGRHFFQTYVFAPVADLPAPKGGQIVVVTQTPHFGAAHILLLTDGTRTVRQLYDAWRTAQVTPQAVMDAVIAEQQARAGADASLQQQVTALQQAANRALVFQNRAELEAWTASGDPLPPPNPPYTPVDVQIGWMALFRDQGEPDLWWDGSEWLHQEVNIDLSGYRTAAEQDVLDAAKAPVHSPVLTGIPQVPTPDYTVPQQAVPVGELVYILENMTSLMRGRRRTYERGIEIRPDYRRMERSAVQRVPER